MKQHTGFLFLKGEVEKLWKSEDSGSMRVQQPSDYCLLESSLKTRRKKGLIKENKRNFVRVVASCTNLKWPS